MRKPFRPFVTEYKSRKPPKNAALFDEGTVADELPSRDINADFDEQPSDAGYDTRYKEALRAADSVFGVAKPKVKSEAPPEAPTAPERTVLSDLSYEDPLEARLAAAALVKRGRKPGTKNKPKMKIIEEFPNSPARAWVETAPATPVGRAALAPPLATSRPAARRRRYFGFIRQLEEKRTTKPGDKWKLKLRGK